MIKKVYNYIVKILPFKYSILNFVAALPIKFKSEYVFRVTSNISQYCDRDYEVVSNLGINDNLKIRVKISNTVQAFGNPELYISEISTLELCSNLLSHSDSFLDIGAHIGYFCFYLENKNTMRTPLHFFEPDSDLYSNLTKNIKANNLSNINGSDIALSDKNGELTFFKNLNDSSSGSIKNTFNTIHKLKEIKVATSTFDNYVEHLPYNKYILKVDVESAEFEFIKGAEKEIEKIKYLIIELLQDSIDNKFPLMMIEKYNFKAYYINNFELYESIKGEYQYQDPYYNWLFTKDSKEELTLKLKDTRFKIRA